MAGPYETRARMPEGPLVRGRHAGLPVDATERRPLRILTSEEAAPYAPAPGELVAANFRHEGRFWIAKFPAGGVESVIFQKWDFGQLWVFHVAHTELRFRMREGREVLLYPQEAVSGKPEPAHRVRDAVNSVEAVGPAGTSFNVWGGLWNHFVAVRRFKSLRESFYERVTRERRVIHQWELALDEDRRARLLERAIRLSDGEGLGVLYHLFLRSCTTSAFELLDSVMEYGIRTWRAKVFKRVPHFPEFYLWFRRLLARRLPPLNAEMPAWRSDPALRERFRAERACARAARRA